MARGEERKFISGPGASPQCINIGLPATLVLQRLEVYGYATQIESRKGGPDDGPFSVYWVSNKVTGEKIYYPSCGLLRFYVADDTMEVFIPKNQIEHFEAAMGWKLV